MESTPTSHPAPYIERFGLSLNTALMLLMTAGIFIVAVIMTSLHGISDSWPFMEMLAPLIGCSWWLMHCDSFRRIALRVDHQGVAFGVPPWPFGSRNQELPTVPWRDLRQIVLWDHYPNGGLIRQAWIGLALGSTRLGCGGDHADPPPPNSPARTRG